MSPDPTSSDAENRDAELHDLLSALLDGELAPAEASEVRAYVDRHPEAQVELDDLARVRSWVRDLPAVDPPFGFYERLLRPPAPARRFGPKLAAALGAAAAAVVVLVGVTPLSDRVAPPVNAYAERHMHMVAPTPDPAAGGGTIAGSAPATTGGSGSVPGSVAPPLTVPSSALPGSESFQAMPAAELDGHGIPAQLTTGYRRMGGYIGDGGVMHLMYTNGTVVVSVYEQSGTVAWDALPTAGTRSQVGSMPSWDMSSDNEEVMVVERGTTVYTLVAVAAHDEMIDVVMAMPEPPAPSMAERAQQASHTVVASFGFDQ